MKKEFAVEICAAFLVLLFTYTAASKFTDYHKFVYQMQRSPIALIHLSAPVLGVAVPVVESLIIIGLLLARARQLSLYASIALLSIFEIYITAMVLSGQHLPCSCGGVISALSWKAHILFNAIWIVIAAAGIYFGSKSNAPINKFLKIKNS
jgi:putative oxidoreductase